MYLTFLGLLAAIQSQPFGGPLIHLSPIHPPAVVLAVNKCENASKADLQAAEFWGSGLEPIPVSAISGSGEGRCGPVQWVLCEFVQYTGSHARRPSAAQVRGVGVEVLS